MAADQQPNMDGAPLLNEHIEDQPNQLYEYVDIARGYQEGQPLELYDQMQVMQPIEGDQQQVENPGAVQ